MLVVCIDNKMKDKLIEEDVGMAEDMANMLKQLICAEDHIATNISLGNPKKWMKVLDIVRKIRTKWLSTITKKGEGTLWCMNKHLLAASEGLIEVGNRFYQTKQYEEAKEAFNDAQDIMILVLQLNDLMEINKDVATKAKSSA